jgi:hypothetical protein
VKVKVTVQEEKECIRRKEATQQSYAKEMKNVIAITAFSTLTRIIHNI